MKFSIVTPSFNHLQWLKLCVASVADQNSVDVEHIVQDAGSTDGTQEWLGKNSQVKTFIEKDSGMYDAINRGFHRANGDVVAHLNCDEQYLPGALAAVGEMFAQKPHLDIVIADTVVVDAEGKFICCRKSMKPIRALQYVQNPTITSSLFMHRRVITQYELFFDTRWRVLGDIVWIREAMRQKLKMGVLRRYTSTFTETGANLDLTSSAFAEAAQQRAARPFWAKSFESPLRMWGRLRRIIHGTYTQSPFDYEIYTHQSPARRVRIQVANPTCVWWGRSPRQAGGTYRFLKKKFGGMLGNSRTTSIL